MRKKIFDLLLSFILILVFSPVFILLSALIMGFSGRPIFFLQERAGKNKKPFKIIKFRTMSPALTSATLLTVQNDPRVTKIGKIFRKYKLDELPQLFNVLRGDMSFVGPRPEVFKYIDCYPKDYETILSVKPGITDPWAIEHFSEEGLFSSFESHEKKYIEEILPKKISVLKEYVNNQNFIHDFKFIFQTVFKLFFNKI